MERGTILRWFKAEGEAYEIGESLYEVETEKVVNEIEAKLPGTLCRILIPEDEEHPVGTLLAVVADPGEEPTEADIQEAIDEERVVERGDDEEQISGGSDHSEEAPNNVPAGSSSGSAVSSHPGSSPTGSSESVRSRSGGGGRVRAMPKVRALAKELGVELESVEGTGKDGAITADDVRDAATQGEAGADQSVASGVATISERRPLSGVGRTMAQTVSRSWSEVPQFVQMVEFDVSGLVARRQRRLEEVKQEHGVDLSYTDLFLEALVAAVGEEPLANSAFGEGEIVVYEDVNVSVAVATDAGLLVPVLHGAQRMNLGERAVALRKLGERTRAGKLASTDFEGGTITLSNLGMHGVEGGTPLVTSPQAAVVFVGAMVERPWVVDAEIVPRPTVSVSTGFDHRVLDGVSAARFTTAFRSELEVSS